ncbi:MAG: 2-oxo-4-hydroxy-4-carboxy-5-ureidoimidazoline decarboxylase [Acetobacteraceae bacterium]|nr:2-oxo-4-hydroxy-4-carboxy-5-ureidoimidazoline decarboxylase [Acetobacteraceae bacterium]
MIQLEALNDAAPAAFSAALDGIFEHAPWVAERTARGATGPFPSLAALHGALMATVEAASPDEFTAFLNAHPELSSSAVPADLTPDSTAEQAGLSMAGAAGAADLPTLNRAYRERCGFPFIICVARHTPENILRRLAARLATDPASERAATLDEIRHITLLRLLARVAGPGAQPTTGHLSTHVLDASIGRPAAGLAVTLLQEGRPVCTTATNDDGRTPPLLPAGPLRQGRYTLTFDTGPYFARQAQPVFFGKIPVPFAITESEGRYHIPLLLTPFSYSSYRGS